MATIAVWLKIDEKHILRSLQEGGEKLKQSDAEVALDFSSVGRVDPSTLRGMAELADIADGKVVKVVLRGVSVDVYKVLKLARLTSRFLFAT